MDASQANSMLNSFDAEMEDIELEMSHQEDPESKGIDQLS